MNSISVDKSRSRSRSKVIHQSIDNLSIIQSKRESSRVKTPKLKSKSKAKNKKSKSKEKGVKMSAIMMQMSK
jgi:hypothetical protein